MSDPTIFPLDGGCDCRQLRYRMRTPPLFVHCCHCRWCQRESGSAFALNAMIEADRIGLLAGAFDCTRQRGATLLEAYPMHKPERADGDMIWFGVKAMYDGTGFEVVARRKPQPPVVRLALGR